MSWSTRLAATSAILALACWAACGDSVTPTYLVGDPCTDTCGVGLFCDQGFCFEPAPGSSVFCASNADCAGGTTCDTDGGFCVAGGERCKADVDCGVDETCDHGICFLGVATTDGGAWE